MPVHRIAGEWRGHYVHQGRSDLGDSFSAFISETEGHIEGTVIDDNGPSPASLNGSFAFPSIAFTKVYSRGGTVKEIEKRGDQTLLRIGVYGPPVEYEGSMTDDGKTMHGTWIILTENNMTGTGTWTAYRVEEEELKESKGTEQRITDKAVLDHLA